METNKKIHQIYDKMFKKILTLSSTAVINMINGLFHTDYPIDSTITYNWTEFEDDALRKVLADTIITINGIHSYHMEAQMTVNDSIIFRVFDYGYRHASLNHQQQENSCILTFPEPQIIYLYAEKEIPAEYVLILDFGTQGSFEYKVPTFNYLKVSMEELNRRHLAPLIPFSLLRLQCVLKRERTPETLLQLKHLIQNDIIRSINKNLEAGNITLNDAIRLQSLTHMLYNYLYAHYEEMEELNAIIDESLMLDIDIIEKQYQQEIDSIEKQHQQNINVLENALAEKEQEILRLKQQLEASQPNMPNS